jgi:transposase
MPGCRRTGERKYPRILVAVEEVSDHIAAKPDFVLAFLRADAHPVAIGPEGSLDDGSAMPIGVPLLYFRVEDHVAESHLLRVIERLVSFDFVRRKLKPFYSETGRPSIDPALLLRILLVGYLYRVTSERKLIEELRMHLARRWFTGLTFD